MKYFKDLDIVMYNHIQILRGIRNTFNKDYYSFSYIHEGEVEWKKNNGKLHYLKGPVAWFRSPEDNIIFGRQDRKPWNHRFISFNGLRVKEFIDKKLIKIDKKQNYIKISNPHLFAETFDSLISHLKKAEKTDARSVHIVEGLFLMLSEQKKKKTISSLDSKINILIKKIKLNPELEWNIDLYAEEQGLSVFHFRREFTKVSGISPRQLLIKIRMQKAAELLKQAHLPVKMVADRVGYEDVFYFTKAFKNYFTLPPASFRKEALLKQ